VEHPSQSISILHDSITLPVTLTPVRLLVLFFVLSLLANKIIYTLETSFALLSRRELSQHSVPFLANDR